MSIVSCDDYLDLEPVGKVIPKSVEDYRSFLTTAYATIKETHHDVDFVCMYIHTYILRREKPITVFIIYPIYVYLFC